MGAKVITFKAEEIERMIIACNENPKCKGCVLLKSNNCFIDEIRANIVEDKKYQNDDY